MCEHLYACVHKPTETRIVCQIMELEIQVVVSNNVVLGLEFWSSVRAASALTYEQRCLDHSFKAIS